MTTTTEPYVCLCGAAGCNTPGALEARARLVAEREAERDLNRRAFDLYWADRQAGIPLRTPAEYRDAASKEP